MSTEPDPARAFLPFSTEASGYVPGEGGAILVAEDLAAARKRGASHVYGEIAGYAATLDPAPGSGRPPGLARAARTAVADAGLTPPTSTSSSPTQPASRTWTGPRPRPWRPCSVRAPYR